MGSKAAVAAVFSASSPEASSSCSEKLQRIESAKASQRLGRSVLGAMLRGHRGEVRELSATPVEGLQGPAGLENLKSMGYLAGGPGA
jgi:hypothetical protein